MHILNVQSSARQAASITRQLSDALIERLRAKHGDATVIEREVGDGLPVITSTWTEGSYLPPEQRADVHREALRVSDELVAELQAADIVVIGAPVYNFSIPAALKLWIDQIARAGVTFRYSESGPVGLLENKKAYVVVASGGTDVGSPVDFHTGYMRHVLGFIGIRDVEFIAADGAMTRGADAARAAANDDIERVAAA